MSVLFWISYAALWLLAVVSSIAVIALLSHFGTLYAASPQGRAQQGPTIGSHIKSAELRDTQRRAISLPIDKPAVLLFVSTNCSACAGLRPALSDPEVGIDLSRIVIVCNGSKSLVESWAAELPPDAVVVADPGNKLGRRYEVDLVPFGIAVFRNGTVAETSIVNDASGVMALLASAVGLVTVNDPSSVHQEG